MKSNVVFTLIMIGLLWFAYVILHDFEATVVLGMIFILVKLGTLIDLLEKEKK